MTERKVVVKVPNMNVPNRKCLLFPNCRRQDNRSKALQIAATIPGFQSLSLKGTDQNVIEVTGYGIDAVELTTKLRKSVGHAMLETVDDLAQQPPSQPPPSQPPSQPPPLPLPPPPPLCQSYYVMDPEPPCCTIM